MHRGPKHSPQDSYPPRHTAKPVCGRTGKRLYPSLKEAKQKLKEIRAQGGTRAGRFERRAYLCSYCHNWHLTSSASKSESRPIARKPPSMVHSDTRDEQKRIEDLWLKWLDW